MKKNSQLHLHLETELFERLKRESEQNFLTVAEWCRVKLRNGDYLKEMLLVLKNIERKVYSKE